MSMKTKCICDACGKEIVEEEKGFPYGKLYFEYSKALQARSHWDKKFFKGNKIENVCPECLRKIDRFIDELKENN